MGRGDGCDLIGCYICLCLQYLLLTNARLGKSTCALVFLDGKQFVRVKVVFITLYLLTLRAIYNLYVSFWTKVY